MPGTFHITPMRIGIAFEVVGVAALVGGYGISWLLLSLLLRLVWPAVALSTTLGTVWWQYAATLRPLLAAVGKKKLLWTVFFTLYMSCRYQLTVYHRRLRMWTKCRQQTAARLPFAFSNLKLGKVLSSLTCSDLGRKFIADPESWNRRFLPPGMASFYGIQVQHYLPAGEWTDPAFCLGIQFNASESAYEGELRGYESCLELPRISLSFTKPKDTVKEFRRLLRRYFKRTFRKSPEMTRFLQVLNRDWLGRLEGFSERICGSTGLPQQSCASIVLEYLFTIGQH